MATSPPARAANAIPIEIIEQILSEVVPSSLSPKQRFDTRYMTSPVTFTHPLRNLLLVNKHFNATITKLIADKFNDGRFIVMIARDKKHADVLQAKFPIAVVRWYPWGSSAIERFWRETMGGRTKLWAHSRTGM